MSKGKTSPFHFLSQIGTTTTTGAPSTSTVNNNTTNYRLLLQSSLSFPLRLEAASTTSSAQQELYQRAGVRTPSETALRDVLGGPLWLMQLVEQWVVAHQPSSSSSSCSCCCDILWISTVTRKNPTRDSVLTSFEQQYPNTKVTILHAAPDPWGWDTDDDDNDNDNESATEPKGVPSPEEKLHDATCDTSSIRLDNLPRLAQTIEDRVRRLQQRHRQQQQATTTTTKNTTTTTPGRHVVLLAWESLSPLLACHGAGPTLQLIQKCGGSEMSKNKNQDERVKELGGSCSCITLVPVVQELLTPVQHAQWEEDDAALLRRRGACFCLHDGEMTLIRNGVRETGNIVRETLGFEVVPAARSSTSSTSSFWGVTGGAGAKSKNNASLSTGAAGRYRLVLTKPEDATAALDDEDDSNPNNNKNRSNRDEEPTTTPTANRGVATPPPEVGRRGGGGKIQLRLEEEDETRGSLSPEPASNTTSRARIFLQDDDPEFDDLDEDDPDDDLDI